MATFFNQAVLSYNGNTTTSNVTTGELLEVLSATKTAVDGTYRAGDPVTYVISIVNSSTAPFTGLTITDNLGAYVPAGGTAAVTPLTFVGTTLQYYVNGVAATPPTVAATDPLTVSGVSVPAGGNATIIYEARLNGTAPLGTDGTVTNTATISGGGVTPVTVDATITAEEAASLTISKSLSPATVTENGQLTYTFVIQNSGNTATTAADAAVVTDTFDPRLSNITVTFNGATWTAPANYTYDETTGVFATVPGELTVPAATYTQNPATGAVTVNPGVSVLTVTGTV